MLHQPVFEALESNSHAVEVVYKCHKIKNMSKEYLVSNPLSVYFDITSSYSAISSSSIIVNQVFCKSLYLLIYNNTI